jgi:hypothetical protein
MTLVFAVQPDDWLEPGMWLFTGRLQSLLQESGDLIFSILHLSSHKFLKLIPLEISNFSIYSI